MMLEDIIVLIIVFGFSVYIAQIFFVIIDLCMGRYGIFSKKQIKMMLIPFGFMPILIEKYKEKGE